MDSGTLVGGSHLVGAERMTSRCVDSGTLAGGSHLAGAEWMAIRCLGGAAQTTRCMHGQLLCCP